MGQRLRLFFTPRRRCLAAAVALGTLLAVLLTGWCSFGRVCAQVRSQTLRLHVLANSDSPADQDLKLQVRDALVVECGRLFKTADSLQQAEALAEAALPQLQQTAEKVVREAGYDYPVAVKLTNQYFDTRVYDDEYTLPAGRYEALRVELGAADGHNWWCVLFPPLCLPAAEEDPDILKIWGEDGTRLVTGDYEVRFAVMEWLQNLREKQTA